MATSGTTNPSLSASQKYSRHFVGCSPLEAEAEKSFLKRKDPNAARRTGKLLVEQLEDQYRCSVIEVNGTLFFLIQ